MNDHQNLYIFITFIIFISSAAIQLFYYLYYYAAIHYYKPPEKKPVRLPVSIIVCARNEAENLEKFLPSVLEQNYPDYEVIVVNDCSEDSSYLILGKFLLQYPHLRVSTVNKDPKFTHNKKFAQFIGIKAAKNEILLFTDADCQPESDKWLGNMTSHFDSSTNFVLGYGGYMQTKGLLNKYIRYDCLFIAMQYLGMAIRGVPYMGVGRNLAYRRSLFFANAGFGAHNHLISGDDDLLVNSNSTSTNTTVEFRTESHTRSVPSSDLKEYLIQKKRHLTTAPYYKTRDQVLLLIEPVTRILFYTAMIILICCRFNWIGISSVFLLRFLTQITIHSQAGKKLNEDGLLPYLLVFDLFSPVLNGILFLSNSGKSTGKNRWR